MRSITILLFGAAVVLAAVLVPLVHLAVAMLNFIVHLAIIGMQLFVSRFTSRTPPRTEAVGEEPFVSIHVPTHNEPPEVVLQTLRSLSKLKWSNYEVLVIDNNTSDPKLWRPLAEYCQLLGSRFRFHHVEGLAGFKRAR